MVKTREDFQPEVGGFLDDSDGEIMDAVFEEAGADYAAQMVGATGKAAIGVTLTIESPGLERPLEQWFSIGGSDNWEISSDGREVTNIKHPDRHAFRKGSRGWDLVEAMAKAESGGSVEEGQELWAKKDKPYMTQAAFYIGGNYHWMRKALPKVGGGTTDVPLPETFLGEVKGKAAPVSVAGTDELDKVVIGLVQQGMTERDVKTAAARNEELKKNAAYMALVISGNKLEELEKAGKITKAPDKTYV